MSLPCDCVESSLTLWMLFQVPGEKENREAALSPWDEEQPWGQDPNLQTVKACYQMCFWRISWLLNQDAHCCEIMKNSFLSPYSPDQRQKLFKDPSGNLVLAAPVTALSRAQVLRSQNRLTPLALGQQKSWPADRGSRTPVCISLWSPLWGFRFNRSGVRPRVYLSNKFPADADDAGSRANLWEPVI